MEHTLTFLLFDGIRVPRDQVVSRWARRDAQIPTAGTLQEAREILDQDTPELLCLRLQSPDENAMAWVDALRKERPTMGVVDTAHSSNFGLTSHGQNAWSVVLSIYLPQPPATSTSMTWNSSP